MYRQQTDPGLVVGVGVTAVLQLDCRHFQQPRPRYQPPDLDPAH